MSNNLSTIQLPYRLLRDTVSTADNDLAASTAPNKTWSTFVSTYHPDSGSSAIAVQLRPTENRLTVIFDFENADDDEAALSLYGYKEKGPAEFICSTTGLTAGAQASDFSSTTRYFCDTITALTQRWPNTVGRSDYEGNDGVAKLTFDVRGYRYVLCLFTTISGNDEVRAWFSAH